MSKPHARRRQPRALPSVERAHAGRRNESAVSLRDGSSPHPPIQELLHDAVWGSPSNCTAHCAGLLGGGLIRWQQDSPKSNYRTRLASKDSWLMNVPSCTWSALSHSRRAGCSTVEQRGGKWQMSSASSCPVRVNGKFHLIKPAEILTRCFASGHFSDWTKVHFE